jgi:hypothetical protein
MALRPASLARSRMHWHIVTMADCFPRLGFAFGVFSTGRKAAVPP